MKKPVIFLIAFILVSSGLFAQRQQPELTDTQKLLNAMHRIKSQTLYHYVDTLASPVFEGRLTGGAGYIKAAAYVSGLLKSWNIKPLGTNGGYLQEFPHPYTRVFNDCNVQMHIKIKEGEIIKNYVYIDDFMPGSTSGNGEITADVVFVGYGITAPELRYDDYAGMDVEGKIVLLTREGPLSPSDEDFLKWRPYTFHQYKLLNAVKHGAKGMLYYYGPIGNPNNAYSEGFIYSHVGKTVVKDIFAGTGKSVDKSFSEIRKKLKPRSFDTKKVFTIKNTTEYHPDGVGANVIGYFEGSDPVLKDEYIMVGGHLDHLGHCFEIIPGADDNASAVAVTLGIAKILSGLDLKLKRSVIFLFPGAEEAALKGSQYFLKHPPVPLDKIAGFINMDGVGRGNSIFVGFGKNYPGFYSFLEKANNSYIHRVMRTSFSSNLARPRLDAAFFDWYGIPVLSLSSFGNAGGAGTYRYHTPYDNITNITPEIMEDISQLLFMAIYDMANRPQLEFKRGEAKVQFIQ